VSQSLGSEKEYPQAADGEDIDFIMNMERFKGTISIPTDEEMEKFRQGDFYRGYQMGFDMGRRLDKDSIRWLIDNCAPMHYAGCAGQPENDYCICGVSDKYEEILNRASSNE